jgi:hypothetical protein
VLSLRFGNEVHRPPFIEHTGLRVVNEQSNMLAFSVGAW